MKKTFLLLACSCMLTLGAHAQSLYLGAGLGYGFRAGGTVLGTNNTSAGGTEAVRGSYGSGFNPNLTVGYLFLNDLNMGAELNFGYLIGMKTMVDDDFGNNTSSTEYGAKSFYLNPSFVIRANDDWKIVPYAKIGVFLGLANTGLVKTHEDHYNGAGTLIGTDDSEFEYKRRLATGLTSAFGLDFMLSEKFAVFGEMNARLASWAPGSYTASNTSVDYVAGNAQPANNTSVSGNFEKEIPPSYTGTDVSTQVLPFSAIGLNVGVRLYLGR